MGNELTQEKQLVEKVKSLLAEFDDYQSPIIRADGDIVIPLDPVLKKNRESQKGLAEAISNMMDGDKSSRRSTTWVE